MSLQREIDARTKEIHTDSYPMSIGELISIYVSNELDIHPEFQRFFRWSSLQKSRFIESLLLGIPVPPVFVAQREDGVWDVVDGLQRLSTIFNFVGDLRDENNKKLPPLRLESTDYLPSLKGKLWSSKKEQESFTSAQRLFFKRAKIDINIIKRESDETAKFDLFQRLNTGGSQLSDQELRNCLLIMVKRDFYLWLKGLQSHAPFREAIAPSERAIDEQYDLELILRFLACALSDNAELKSIGDMADFLTKTSLNFAKSEGFDRDAHARLFRTTFSIIYGAMEDLAFRRYDSSKDRFVGGFSVSAFEAVSSGIAKNVDSWEQVAPDARRIQILEATKQLWTHATFKKYSGSGVRASSRIPQIIPLAVSIFAPR